MNIDAFWNRVKFLIKTHKTTQEKIAVYIDIPFRTFRNWIYYKRAPDIGTAVSLSIALGVSIEYLIFGEDRQRIEDRMLRLLERKSAAAEIHKLAKIIVDESGKI